MPENGSTERAAASGCGRGAERAASPRPATKADVARDWLLHPLRRWRARHIIRTIKRYQRNPR